MNELLNPSRFRNYSAIGSYSIASDSIAFKSTNRVAPDIFFFCFSFFFFLLLLLLNVVEFVRLFCDSNRWMRFLLILILRLMQILPLSFMCQ